MRSDQKAVQKARHGRPHRDDLRVATCTHGLDELVGRLRQAAAGGAHAGLVLHARQQCPASDGDAARKVKPRFAAKRMQNVHRSKSVSRIAGRIDGNRVDARARWNIERRRKMRDVGSESIDRSPSRTAGIPNHHGIALRKLSSRPIRRTIRCIVKPRNATLCIASPRIALPCIALPRIALPCIALPRIASPRTRRKNIVAPRRYTHKTRRGHPVGNPKHLRHLMGISAVRLFEIVQKKRDGIPVSAARARTARGIHHCDRYGRTRCGHARFRREIALFAPVRHPARLSSSTCQSL